ncbi:P-loop containing nucleoside triphosphate hydrolase [Pseudocohnilembus persalinus]|uniref:p-loop containing nucleoside triphosphate hydrolase n=1 Tax=Pseudocohnilembus persalinus TaxID=266149 RepID=A0A0V0Q8B7_PSEPJ|nr:P-loop containing nucleoside triphosphate hydrolase [Pseudocohnilembus persalinus]|eukprot:KRW98292.1 P-loop containing nucleoside triphosphate hydrolase [Pseudocohnilembus persalinus]
MQERQKKEYDAKEFVPCDLKVILLGDSAVGKSKLVERFLQNDYEERQQSTFALNMYRHQAEINGNKYNVDLWDTAGQEVFQTLHPSYYFQAHACILVFDVTRKITYINLKKWYTEMRENCPDIPCIILANKIDADMEKTKLKFKFAQENNCPFYFVSAADGTNVVKIFEEALKGALEYKNKPSADNEIMEFLKEI